MELLVLRCHLKDPSQSILCYPSYLPSKGEGLSWSFWDWNLWFQGNLSILTLRSLLLSRSFSIWQVIFVEFHNLDPGPVPVWNVSSFCLLLKCIAHEVKYICFSVAVKPQEFWNLGDLKWHFQGARCVYINSFHMASLSNLTVQAFCSSYWQFLYTSRWLFQIHWISVP